MIKIDGSIDESDWAKADTASDFWMKFPNDDTKAINKTIVRLSYDDNFLYIGAIINDSAPYIGQSLKRDSRIRENDGFGVILDPVNKKTNGFYFSVTAYNVQADDQLTGNNGDLNFSWDNKWYSEVQRFKDHYTVEMAIPFKSIRYEKDNTIWGINFINSELKKNEFHTWARVPVNFPGVDLGYTGGLYWDAPPPKPGSNMVAIPYVTGSVLQDKLDGTGITGKLNAGFDAKIALSSALNLDLTTNPDFSQVEVDRQVTNLSRFNIFFPERRTFFLENDDLFSNYGIPPVRPFYSRTIGLGSDGQSIPILAGARLTGNLNKTLRVGAMSMQTGKKEDIASQNYSAFNLTQQLFSRSTIKAYFLNHETFQNEEQDKADPLSKYGRNAGAEFNYVNKKGTWNAYAGYHQSFKEGINNKNLFLNGGTGFESRNFSSFIDFTQVGENYYTDMGFVGRIENYDAVRDTSIRVGFHQFFNSTQLNFYPKKSILNRHGPSIESFLAFNPDGSFNERNHELGYEFGFRNTSQLQFSFNNQHVQLLYPLSFTDSTPLPAARYDFNQYGFEYKTDVRAMFSAAAGILAGQFYNGDYQQYTAGITYRKQPWLTVEMKAEINRLRFPSVYSSTNLFLLSPRVEINFANNLFWTTFIQYNTQQNNFNINSRFQWRYKPMSDLFLVYTDNYFTTPFLQSKTRSFVFKLNYWLNL